MADRENIIKLIYEVMKAMSKKKGYLVAPTMADVGQVWDAIQFIIGKEKING